jgi:hypothetical protein
MSRRFFWVAYRWLFALLGLSVVIYQIWGIATGNYGLANITYSGSVVPFWVSLVRLFSYFTIESNVIGFIVMGFTGYFALKGRQSPLIDLVRLSSTVYLTITAIVFWTLLVPGLGLVWEYSIQMQHTILPLMIILDWFLSSSTSRFSFKQTLWLLIYPAVYIIYTMIRGAFTTEYPYFFLDPTQSSIFEIIIYLTVIFIFGLGLANLYKLKMPRSLDLDK